MNCWYRCNKYANRYKLRGYIFIHSMFNTILLQTSHLPPNLFNKYVLEWLHQLCISTNCEKYTYSNRLTGNSEKRHAHAVHTTQMRTFNKFPCEHFQTLTNTHTHTPQNISNLTHTHRQKQQGQRFCRETGNTKVCWILPTNIF